MLTSRQVLILQKLNDLEYITSKELGFNLSISDRTIRSEIKILKDLYPNIYQIHSSKMYGYKLQILEYSSFQKLIDKNYDLQDYIFLQNILAIHTLENTPINQDTLKNMLFISINKLRQILIKMEQNLIKDRIYLEYMENKGYILNGSEYNLRRVMQKIIPQDYFTSNFKQKYKFIKDKLHKFINNNKLIIYDDLVNKFIISIFIAHIRNKYSYKLIYLNAKKSLIKQNKYYMNIKRLLNNILQELNIVLLEDDYYYLAELIIISKKKEKTIPNNYNITDQIISKVITRIDQEFNINFARDCELKKWLKIHIDSLFARITFDQHVNNFLLNKIKIEYPLAFQMAIICNKIILENTNYTMNEDEIGYIAIHFSAAITRNKKCSGYRKKGIVICSANTGSALLLKEQIELELGNYIDILGVYSYEEAKNFIETIDFIFTTIPIEHKVKNKVIFIRNILDSNLLSRVKKVVTDHTITIDHFFKPKNFYRYSTKTKKDAMEYLFRQMLKNQSITESIIKSIHEREMMSPTDIGNLIAIPHPIENNMNESNIGIMILDEPILWSDNMVQIIILIIVAKKDIKHWEPLFLNLFNYLIRNNGRDNLIENKDYELFIKEIKNNFRGNI